MNNNDMKMRVATEADAKELLDIYKPYVEKTAITFEYDVPSLQEFQRRIKKTLERFPYLVAIINDEIVGYAYTGYFKERSAYDWSVETTIYLKENKKRMGIGKVLYQALEDISRKQNVMNMNACIGYPEVDDEYLTKNSAQFHEHFGYKMVGLFHHSGYKFGVWYHMVWMEKMVAHHPKHPQPFIPFSKLNKNIINELLNKKTSRLNDMYIMASDLDGTLIFDEKIKDNDLNTINEFQDKGHKFGVCTGRPLGGVINRIGSLKPDFYILSTGALILDGHLNTIYQQTIDQAIVRQFYYEYNHYTMIIHTDCKEHIILHTVDHQDQYDNQLFLKINTIDTIKDSLVYSLSLIVDTTETAMQLQEEINFHYPMLEGFVNGPSIDIVAKGCSKGNAILQIKKRYQKAKVAAIGDEHNDETMLDACDFPFTFHYSPKHMQEKYNVVSCVEEAIKELDRHE